MKKIILRKEEKHFLLKGSDGLQTISKDKNQQKCTIPWMKFATAMLCVLLCTACQKDAVMEEEAIHDSVNKTPSATLRAGSGIIQIPLSGSNCTHNFPPSAPAGAGNSTKESWHRVVRNQSELVSAIHHVNANGGTIFIDATFDVTSNLPKITHNNITILSRNAYKIIDKISGSTSANELFRVEGAHFIMRNVTIDGVGHLNPNNPYSWSGKRSAVVVTRSNARFECVCIRYYTHAAIRLENGSGHRVLNSILANQNRSDLGYGVLLRNSARNVLIKHNCFDKNSHSVATTGGRNQSYRAEGNLTMNTVKWHFDVHMGRDGWGGNKVEIINNVTRGNGSLLLVRGPFVDGVYVRDNFHNGTAGKLVEIKPDRTFSKNGSTFLAGHFYSPFGLQQSAARNFFRDGEIIDNCVDQ